MPVQDATTTMTKQNSNEESPPESSEPMTLLDQRVDVPNKQEAMTQNLDSGAVKHEDKIMSPSDELEVDDNAAF